MPAKRHPLASLLFGSLLVLFQSAGCGQTVHEGLVVYEFSWRPGLDPEQPIAHSAADPDFDTFVAGTGEDFCEPGKVTAVQLAVSGGITRFDSLRLRSEGGLNVYSGAWSNSAPQDTTLLPNLSYFQVGKQPVLYLTGAEGEPGTLRFTFEVELRCGYEPV